MKKNISILNKNIINEQILSEKTFLILLDEFDNFTNNSNFFKIFKYNLKDNELTKKNCISILEELDYARFREYNIIISSDNINKSAGFLFALLNIFDLNYDKSLLLKNYPNFDEVIYSKFISCKDEATLRNNTSLLSYLAYFDNKIYTNLG